MAVRAWIARSAFRPHRRAALGALLESLARLLGSRSDCHRDPSGWLNGRMTSCSPRRSFHRGAGNGWLSAIRQRVAVCDSVIAEPATGGCLRSDRGAGNGWLSAILVVSLSNGHAAAPCPLALGGCAIISSARATLCPSHWEPTSAAPRMDCGGPDLSWQQRAT